MEKEYSVKELVAALTPLVVFLLGLLNNWLLSQGKPCLEIGNDTITAWLNMIIMTISGIVAWWKNNNVTLKAQEGQVAFEAVKDGKKVIIENKNG